MKHTFSGALRKRRAMTSEEARRVKLAGHQAESEFAQIIGGRIYPGSRKKDVIDTQGNIHSVKSGDKKWQIFLYSRSRFEESIGFFGSALFIACIDSFPKDREKYTQNKVAYKLKLQPAMRALKDFLSHTDQNFIHNNKTIFLQEALFHSSEVDYFTIKEGKNFHIFDAGEVVKTINDSTVLTNSKARNRDQMDDQKVIFVLPSRHITLGEIEMRNDSAVHYRQVKFWMDRKITLALLMEKIQPVVQKSSHLIAYGRASHKFIFSL